MTWLKQAHLTTFQKTLFVHSKYKLDPPPVLDVGKMLLQIKFSKSEVERVSYCYILGNKITLVLQMRNKILIVSSQRLFSKLCVQLWEEKVIGYF